MPQSHRFTLGSLSCATLFDGSRTMPLRAVFPSVPDETFQDIVAAESYPAEVTAGYNILYFKHEQRHCLVDTGLGSGALLESLETINLKPEAVDTVIITHNDGDHVGGLAQFPKAEFVMAKKAWELWTNDESRQGMIQEFTKLFEDKLTPEELKARAAAREQHGAETLPSLKDRIRLVASEEEIMKGIQLLYSPGHRTDHYALEITSGGETLIHVADSIRHPVQANYAWASFIDSYPEQIVQTNEKLVERILQKNALIFGMHFPFPALARLSEQKGRRNWQCLEQ